MFRPVVYSTLLFTFCSFQSLFSQSTKAYFTQEGLSIASYYENFIDGGYSTSFSYYGEEIFCNLEVSVFYHNQSLWRYYMYFDEDKVYMVSPFDCQLTLFFDFGIEVGETIYTGKYQGFTLKDKYPVTLLNSEERLRYDLESAGTSTSWIEGIGDIVYGNAEKLGSFEEQGVFICAKIGEQLLWENPDESENCDFYTCLYPKVDFDAQVNEYSVQFDNYSLFGDLYEWDFGDGMTSDEINPNHIYEEPGCYTVTLSVKRDCRTDWAELNQKVSICVHSAWDLDYYNDSLATLSVFVLNEDIELQFQGNTLLKTIDGGQTWDQLNLPPLTQGDKRVLFGVQFYNENDGIITSIIDGIEEDHSEFLVTHDGGFTWHKKVESPDIFFTMTIGKNGKAWASPSNHDYDKHYLYLTLDYGDHWDKIELENGYHISTFTPLDGSLVIGNAYVGAPPFGAQRKAISYDNGTNWEFIEYYHGIYGGTYFDEQTAYVVSDNTFFTSQNGGQDWIKKELDLNIKSIHFSSPAHGWVIDMDNTVYYTADSLNSYHPTNCDLDPFKYFHVFDDTTAYGVLYDKPGQTSTGRRKLTFNKNLLGGCSTVLDLDGDGYPADIDCDDTNGEVHPDAQEISGNMIDDDCDGEIDELVNLTSENERPAFSIYPNPARQTMFIESKNVQFKEAILYTNLGEIVTQTQNSQIDISSIPRGLYLLKILDTNNTILATKKIVLQ